MEAALRYAVELLNGKPLEKVELEAVRGVEGIKEGTIEAGGMKIKAAAASGTGNAKKLLEKIKNGEAEYHFVEIMANPLAAASTAAASRYSLRRSGSWVDLRSERAKALYEEDENLPLRKSQDNLFCEEALRGIP